MNYSLLLAIIACELIACVVGFRMVHKGKVNSFNLKPLRSIDTSIQEEEADRAIKDLFQQQLQELLAEDFRKTQIKQNLEQNRKESFPQQNKQKRVVLETPTPVYVNTPIEYIDKGKLCFGNFIQQKGDSTAIIVRSPSGEESTIDISQVISIWDVLSDYNTPTSEEDWANVVMEALAIFQRMSPRKTDLEEFWSAVAQRSSSITVDSLDLAVYIFQEKKFRAWIDPYSEADDVNIYPFSAAQRYAAAMLLFHDPIYFKRKPSKMSWPEDASPNGMNVVDREFLIDEPFRYSKKETKAEVLPASYILEGGYTILDEGITTFKICDIFCEYYQNNRISTEKSKEISIPATIKDSDRTTVFKLASVNRMIRSLELYALTRGKVATPKLLKSILKRLNLSLSPTGAKTLLIELGCRRENSHADEALSSENPIASTPWSSVALQEAKKLEEIQLKQRVQLQKSPLSRSGKRAPNGKFDFRALNEQHPVICLDPKNAAFYDDAFSLNPETGEILIHVIDVVDALKDSPILRDLAKDRVASAFMPLGALHMFPPQALEALKLSKTHPNEVITVALSIDYSNGEIISSRVFPSIIGPVFPIELQKADELIEGVGVKVSKIDGVETSSKFVYPDAVVRDLRSLDKLVRRMVERKPWLDITSKTADSKERFDKYVAAQNENDQLLKSVITDHDGAHRIINTLLTAYGNTAHDFCVESGVPVPLAYENRDKSLFDRPRRFASSPLRNWLSLIQQQQVRAALGMNLGLNREQCALAVTHYYTKQKEVRRILQQSRPKNYVVNEQWKSAASSFGNDNAAIVPKVKTMK